MRTQHNGTVTFIFDAGRSTIRDKQLWISTARSHAARAAHSRRKERSQGYSYIRGNSSLNRKDDDPKQHKDLAQDDLTQRAGALTVLRAPNGSSDPFSSLSIPLTPEIAGLISFLKDRLVPALYIMPIGRGGQFATPYEVQNDIALGSRYAKRDCASGTLPDFLPLWLSSNMLAIQPHMPPSVIKRMQYIFLEACIPRLNQIRDSIATSKDGMITPTDMGFLIIFFRVACLENDTVAAKMHAYALKISQRMIDPSMQLYFHIQLTYNDAFAAGVHMRRTYLKPNDPAREIMNSFWASIEAVLPPAPGWANIPIVLQRNGVLARVCGHIRRALIFCKRGIQFTTEADKEYANTIYSWLATTSIYDKGSCINEYLNLIEFDEIKPCPDSSPDSSYEKLIEMSDTLRYTEAAIALALCYTIQKSFLACEVDGFDYVDLSISLTSCMRSALKKAQETATFSETIRYQEAWLWMLFIGAHHEERLRRGLVTSGDKWPYNGNRRRSLTSNRLSPALDEPEEEDSWFEDRLRNLMTTMGLSGWHDLNRILERYTYIWFLAPQPNPGFEWTEDLSLWLPFRKRQRRSSHSRGEFVAATLAQTRP